MKIQNFHELFVHKVQAIYDAENQAIEAMPTMIDLCSSAELKQAMEKHLTESQNQKAKLEDLCNTMNIELEGPSNLAMEGMIDESMELLQDNEPSPILDAAIIAAAQAIEHYEITCYGTAAEWAEQMGHTDAQKILAEIMNEEKETDKKLQHLAEATINKQAADMSGQIAMGRMG
jgi:ferritin-like metal-binding protein YciE